MIMMIRDGDGAGGNETDDTLLASDRSYHSVNEKRLIETCGVMNF